VPLAKWSSTGASARRPARPATRLSMVFDWQACVWTSPPLDASRLPPEGAPRPWGGPGGRGEHTQAIIPSTSAIGFSRGGAWRRGRGMRRR
jgi:hypothetical protein